MLEGICDIPYVLHVVEFCAGIGLQKFLVCFHAEVSALTVEEAFLDDMHSIVITSSQDVETVRAFAVKARLLGRNLQIEAIENGIGIVGSLKLNIGIEIVLDAEVLHGMRWCA